MPVQSVERSKGNVNFRSDLDKATQFVNLNDSQIKNIAYTKSHNKKEDQKANRSINRLIYAIPVVDTLASAILVNKAPLSKISRAKISKASLATRTKAAGKTALGWGVAISAVGLYGMVKRGLTRNSDSSKQFRSEHPLLSFLTDITLILGGIWLGAKGVEKFAKYSSEKNPEPFKKIMELKTTIKEWLNNTSLNKKTLPKIAKSNAKFAKKFPITAAFSRAMVANSIWILAAAAIVKMVGYAGKKQHKAESNYQQLKNAQVRVAQKLTKDMKAQNAALVNQRDALALNTLLLKGENEILLRQLDKSINENKIAKAHKPKKEEIHIKAEKNEVCCEKCDDCDSIDDSED